MVVADNGASLAPMDLEAIFEPYERASTAYAGSPSGVGIGLFVSRLLARRMGGDLLCRVGDGWTTFDLALPAVLSGEVELTPGTGVD